jgi:hypothetical protein
MSVESLPDGLRSIPQPFVVCSALTLIELLRSRWGLQRKGTQNADD